MAGDLNSKLEEAIQKAQKTAITLRELRIARHAKMGEAVKKILAELGE